MFDTVITVVGNLVDEPQVRSTDSGRAVTSFRIASTSRRREGDRFVDGNKLFLTVTCWQDLAHNVATSLRKGQSVVVTGRVFTREYVKNDVRRANYEITADAIGHNLARGTSSFTKTSRAFPITSTTLDDDGLPPDLTEDLLVEDALLELVSTAPDVSF